MKEGTDMRAFFQRRVTFFRAPDHGSIHVDQVSDGRVLAWSRLAMDALPANGKQSLATYRLSIRGVLKQGGIIVFSASGADHLLVEPVKTGQYDPPRTILSLDASGGTKEVALPLGKLVYEIPFAKGDHLLIPVDDAAQRILVQFYQSLEYLSPDQSRTVLNVIARPIEVLRSLTAGSTAAPGSAPLNVASRTAEFVGTALPSNPAMQITMVKPAATANVVSKAASISAATRSVPLTAAIPPAASVPRPPVTPLHPKTGPKFGIAVFFIGLALLWSMIASRRNVMFPSEPAVKATPAATPPSEPAVKTTPKDFQIDAESLLTAMSTSPREPVRRLYQTHHLAAYRGKPDIESHPSFATAVVKLELLRLKVLGPNSLDLETTDASESLRGVRYPLTTFPPLDVHSNLLGHVCCHAFGAPSLLKEAAIPGAPSCRKVDDATVDLEYLMLERYVVGSGQN